MPTTLRRAAVVLLALVVTQLGLAAVPTPARADSHPLPGTPATVTADALPTWQVNGIVWSQVLVGNTVYATGNFTKARPPGVAPGGAGEVTADNLFAFDVRTGNRVASFNHSLNGAGQYITRSPDGSRIYVGGDFTTVDGVARGHVAAFNTADGSLVSTFAPSISARVSGIAVSADTVYLGGTFFNAGGSSRSRLAAVRAGNGALLPWAPATDGTVASLVLTPDGSKVVVGGRFTTLGGAPASGMGAVDPVSAAPLPWAANQRIRNGGAKSSIVSLRADGTDVYGSGWAFGTGNFEGTFSADGSTGEINWLNDCHGDTYDALPVGDVVYNVSHVHDCSAIGGFPESSPRETNMQHASAYTNRGTTTNVGPDSYGWDFTGVPAPTMLQWYPDLAIGTVSGQSQAAWTIAANDQYVVLGGEFPRVNGGAQQGLTRFAVTGLATNKRGPRAAPSAPAPTALSLGAGAIRVTWQAAYDQDDEHLTYQVYRSGTAAPVHTVTAPSSFWRYPMMGFRDSTATPGVSYRYTVRVTDPAGNLLSLPQTNAAQTSAGSAGAYADGVIADGASAYWRLGEDSGSTVYDWAGFHDATAGAGVTRGVAGAIGGTTDGASHVDGTGDGVVASPAMSTTPSFSVEAWVRTSSTSGGKIVGYGASASGNSGSYDRHLYLTDDGRLTFGVYPGAVRTLASSRSYNDGTWHHVVGSLDATTGMSLWVDGKRIASDPGTLSAQTYAGYWRIGGDNLGGWPGQPTSSYLDGDIDDVAVYPASLTKAQVQRHYTDSGRTLDLPPAPTDAYGKAVFTDEPSLYWRLGDPAGTTSVADASGNGSPGLVTDGGIAFGRPGAVTGTPDTAAEFDGATGTLGSSVRVDNPTTYSEELWFRTTTTQGGKLIGFGDAQTGTSGNYDRHVYLEDDGRLTFGVWTGSASTTTTSAAYNDGQWHHLVATQGADGMKLYVDAALVGSNGQTGNQAYSGYWRVGGDTPWNGRTYFRGQLDEVAVYGSVLPAERVTAHYRAGGGLLPNQPPTAAFDHTTTSLTASLDAAGSADPDGTVVSYAWSFGDGQQGTGVTPRHTYAADGTYTVTLTVTDDRGGQAQATHAVTVANRAPEAAFTQQVDGRQVTTDASGSSDPDGTVASYSWSWGDGSPDASGVSAAHTYAAAGSYTVTLTVTDDHGARATTTRTVVATVNQAPTAAFTATATDLRVDVDARASSDADGSVASYAWSWGDGTAAGSGATASHTYATAGTYTVTLTVTDDKGATATATRDVVVSAPLFLVRDTFSRTVSGGWGAAETGGTWVRSGTANRFAVAGGRGSITLGSAGAGPSIGLPGPTSGQTDLTVDVGIDKLPVGGPVYAMVRPRVTAAGDLYHADVLVRPDGTVGVNLSRKIGATDTVLRSVATGLRYAPGERLLMRVQAVGTGPTTLRAKVWKAGTAEPAAWSVTTTDTAAALQVAGSVGLAGYLSGAATNAPVVVSFDDLAVRSGA